LQCRYIATGGKHSQILIWDIESKACINKLSVPSFAPNLRSDLDCFAVLPDGNIVSVSTQKELIVFRFKEESLKPQAEIKIDSQTGEDIWKPS
jgi:hypothetical protein